ncbi:hypothetical protein OHD60_12995 [Escherichia coli]|nr:hypothetical protein [Escherichia coli]
METRLDAEVKSWFAFALQKCHELALLRDALNSGDTAALAGVERPDSGTSSLYPRIIHGGRKASGGDHRPGQPACECL